MTLTDRDRKIVMGLIPLLVIGVYWFMLLSPKREEAATAEQTLTSEQQRLTDAETRASTLGAARESFAADYAAVVRLGKAVPTSVDMPSLLVQLEQAAAGTGIEFEKVTVAPREPLSESGSSAASAAPAAPAPGAPAAPAPGQPAPTAPSGDAAQSAPGAASGTAESAVDSTNAANQAAANADPSATPPAGTPTPAAGTPTPAGGGALETVPLDFSFKGSFFELANFFHRLKRFVYVDGDKVRVRGRLMTIESVAYTTDPSSFPELSAQVTASVFLTPKAEGVAAGATPAGPAPAAPAPGTSTASTGATPPAAPTAAATP